MREFVLLMRQLLCGGGGMQYPDKLRTALAEHSDTYATGAMLKAHIILGPLSPACMCQKSNCACQAALPTHMPCCCAGKTGDVNDFLTLMLTKIVREPALRTATATSFGFTLSYSCTKEGCANAFQDSSGSPNIVIENHKSLHTMCNMVGGFLAL